MTTTIPNGKTRYTLAEQLDRLDTILDGLADGLNEAVATAVREATTSAVRQALVEVLTNPEVLSLIGGAARLHTAAPPPSEFMGGGEAQRASLRQRLGKWVGEQARAARTVCAQGIDAGRRVTNYLWRRLQALWQIRFQLLTALATGSAAGIASYLAGPWLAGVLGGVMGFLVARVAQAWPWLRKLLSGWISAEMLT